MMIMQQLNLLSKSPKDIILKHSEKYFQQEAEKPKKVIIKSLNEQKKKEFWEKVKQEQAKSKMSQSQANYIIENILDWDSYRLEYELLIAGATECEKDFYLKFLYPFGRKQRNIFEKIMQIQERQGNEDAG